MDLRNNERSSAARCRPHRPTPNNSELRHHLHRKSAPSRRASRLLCLAACWCSQQARALRGSVACVYARLRLSSSCRQQAAGAATDSSSSSRSLASCSCIRFCLKVPPFSFPRVAPYHHELPRRRWRQRRRQAGRGRGQQRPQTAW